MPQIINTNIASLSAQNNLNKSQSALNTSLERLSSGLRINSAKDDAAGLAIADRFATQIRGLNQAARNANDGISLSQTAEGALGQATELLQKIRERAVQSANGTNSATDRKALNDEVQQFIAEIDRIATQTDFNGNKILSTTGGFNAGFHVGANVNQTVSFTIASTTTSDIGTASNYGAISIENDVTFAARVRDQYAEDISSTVNGVSVTTVAVDTNSIAKINSLNNFSGSTGVSAFSYGNSLNGAAAADDDATSLAVNSGDVVINGVDVGASALNTADGLVDAINAITAQTGVVADATAAGTGDLVLFNRTGGAINVSINSAAAATRSGFAQGTHEVAAGANGAVVLNTKLNSNTITFGDAGTGDALTGTSGTSTSLTNTSVTGVNVNDVANANLTILAVDEALNTINTVRAGLGAVQNRLESTISSLASTSENLNAAKSRILDADFAAETAALTKAQILQQAGISIVGQANALPQSALAFLQ